MRHPVIHFLLALTLGLSSTLAIAGDNPQSRPFMGTLTGEASWTINEVCLPITGIPFQSHAWTYGEMTHLGLTEHHSTHCSTPDGLHLLNGQTTFVAANGDELWATYTAEQIVPPPDMVYLTEYVVVGGTGRFEGATGEVVALVYVTFLGLTAPAFPMEMNFAGSIAY